MPWLLANWKMVLSGLIIVVSFTAGWVIKGAFDDSAELAAQKARDALIKDLRENEAHIANILERKLKDLKANETIVEKAVIKVIDRPVYHNECMDADGVRIIEQARSGKANPTKSIGEVPRTK